MPFNGLPLIDLHSHLLPNIDDGSRSAADSAKVLRLFAGAGITDVVLTPHLSASEMVTGAEEAVARRERAFQILKGAAPPSPRLALGFEIMLDRPFPALGLGDVRLSLAGSRYYLVEFPLTIVPHFATTVLHQISRSGLIPIVAHPERYQACTPEAVDEWKRAGAKIQIDATTLTRPHSRGRKALALVEAGLADIVAADNHGDNRSVRTAADFLRARGGEAAAVILATTNPGAVLRNEDMMPVPPFTLRRGLGERIARLFGG
jgi:protein-tyrosine phosphatase